MDFRKIFTDSIVSAARTILFVLRRLLVIPVITKYIGEESYGIWVTVIALVAVFAAAGRIHMHGSLIRYTEGDSINPTVLTETVLITLFTTATAGVVVVGVELVLNLFDIQNFSSVERLVVTSVTAGLVFLSGIFNFLINIPRAIGQVKRTEYLLVVQMLAELAIVIPVLYFTRDIILGLVSLFGVLVFLNVAIGLYYIPGNINIPTEWNLSKYLSYGVPLMPKELSDSILSGADKFIILYFLSPGAAGIYAAVYSLCAMFRTGAGVLNTTLYPAVTDAWDLDETKQLQTLYRGIFKGYVFLAIPAFVGLVVVSPTLLRLLATEQVASRGAILVPVIGFGFLIRGLESPISYILNAAERTHVLGTVSVGAAILNVGLNVALIPLIGLVGAAAATLVANVLITGVVIYYASREFEMDIDLRATTKAVLGSAVMWAVLVQLSLPSGIVGLILQIGTGVVIYFGMLIITRGVTRSDIETMVSFVR